MSDTHLSLKRDYDYEVTEGEFSKQDATAYKEFIVEVRARLTGGTTPEGIMVLRHNVPDAERFICVALSNFLGETITVAIDVIDAYVVGYRVDNLAYFLRPDPTNPAPIQVLFPRTPCAPTLPFTGHYHELERAFLRDQPLVRADMESRGLEARQMISLGADPLDEAITNLRNNRHVAQALIVIIQMVSEAVRFRFIEEQVRRSISREETFEAEYAVMSLETHWGRLSAGIQQAIDGRFPPVTLRSVSNTPIEVDNVQSEQVRGIAMIRYVERLPPPRASASRNPTCASVSRGRPRAQ